MRHMLNVRTKRVKIFVPDFLRPLFTYQTYKKREQGAKSLASVPATPSAEVITVF